MGNIQRDELASALGLCLALRPEGMADGPRKYAAEDVRQVAVEHLVEAMRRNQGNQSAVARELGISLRSIQQWIADYPEILASRRVQKK